MKGLKSVKRRIKSQVSEVVDEILKRRVFDFKFGQRKCHFAHYDGAEYFSVPNAKVETELPKLLDHIHNFMQQIESLHVDSLELNRFVAKYFCCEAKTIKTLRGLGIYRRFGDREFTPEQAHFMDALESEELEGTGARICKWGSKVPDEPLAIQESQRLTIQE
jgi:hypothetical protein